MLKTFLFILVFATLSTCLSSPRFWYNLIVRKNIYGDNEHIGLDKNFSNLSDFFKVQTAIFFIQTVVTEQTHHFSRRLTLFCGGTLIILIILFLGQLLYSASLNDNGKRLKKVLISGGLIMILYVALFIQDNNAFSKAQVKEQTQTTEACSDNSIEIPESVLNELINTSATALECSYYSNGKKIYYIQEFGILIVNENNATLVECEPFKNKTDIMPLIPDEIKSKNGKELGIVINENNHPYFAYSLMKKTSFLGSYYPTEYALYDAITKEITYWNELPYFANN